MVQTRRAVLVGAGTTLAVGLAGCSGSGDGDGDGTDDPTATEDAATPTATATPAVTQIVDETVNISEDRYESWQFYVSGEFELNYEFTVTRGAPIDVFVVEHRAFSNYEAQQVFDTVVESVDIESDSVTTQLSEGTYHLIVDHTSAGQAEPPGGLGKNPVEADIAATYREL